MPTYTQENRPVRIDTPLEENVLLLRSMNGTEHLGRPFQYELVLLSEQHDISYKDIIGQNVTVAVDIDGQDPRYFNGYVSRFSQTRYERKLVEYRATVVPWLWFLTRSADCQIFQNMTIPDILKQVFQNHGFSDFVLRLHGTYKPWEYCVQYRETAFDFVSRLMEQEGIYYFCKHQNGKHDLVLCDTVGSHKEFKGYEELLYSPSRDHAKVHEIVWNWVEHHEIQPGTSKLKQFDFKNPALTSVGSASQDRGDAGDQLERFDYLGEMDAESDADRYTKLRLDEWQSEYEVYTGEGDARGICTGVRFKLTGHPRKDFEKEYLTTGTEFRIASDPFDTVEQADNAFVYEAKINAIPVTSEYRTPRRTRKPVVSGPQTAMVVGPKGEEIYTDKYGRVKVQFHWDRQGKADENSSCWIRVAQVWAGKKWGSIYTPRVGQEVIVEFLEGDPDRPIITGRVYNDKNLPPYELPANKTLSTLKSNSSKGGQGFNELRFEDKKSSEQIFIHAEKNLEFNVKNDVYETVAHDRHLTVKNDQVEEVTNDRQEKVTRDHVEQIGRDHHATVKGKEAIKITGSQSVTVEDDVIEVFKKNQSTQVAKDLYIKAENIVIEATENITINVGDSYIAIERGGIKVATNGDIVFEAKGSINQKASADVKIEATAHASMKGTASLKLESPAPAELSSGAILTLKGSLVKIN